MTEAYLLHTGEPPFEHVVSVVIVNTAHIANMTPLVTLAWPGPDGARRAPSKLRMGAADKAAPPVSAAIIGAMPTLRSALDPSSDRFHANADAMQRQVDELRARTRVLSERGAAGDEASIARHRERGKLPVRERIDRLIDPASAFLELSPLAANGLYDDEAPGAGIVTGIGHGRGRRVRHRGQRRDGQGRHLLPDDRQEAPSRTGDRARESICRASTSSTRAARSCRCRTRSSPTASTSAASSTTRRSSRRGGSPRSRW